MSSDWKECSLDDVAELTGGYAFKSSQYVDEGVFVLRTLNISDDGSIILIDAAFVSDEDAREFSRFQLIDKDILFVMVGATLGKIGKVGKEALPALLNQNMWRIRAREKLADQDFLYYSFKESVAEIIGWASGSARGFLRRDDCRNLRMKMPSIEEQKAIAHILGTLDDKIELNRKTLETLEAMAKALFKSWFVDFDPVSAKAEGRPTGLPAEISDLFPDSFEDSELGEIPSGWEVAELGDCELDIESGRRPKGGIDKNLTFGIPSIGAESIAPVGQFDFSKTKWVDNDFAESSGKGWIQNFDVALYKDGGKPGEFRPRTALYGNGFPFEKAMVNEHVFLLRSVQLGQPYLYYLFNFDLVLAQIIHKGSSKGAQPGLNQEEVRTSSFVKPETRLLDAFNNAVEPSIKKKLLIGKQCQVLSQVRDALLPKLISGEIRIPDAEKMLEEVGI